MWREIKGRARAPRLAPHAHILHAHNVPADYFLPLSVWEAQAWAVGLAIEVAGAIGVAGV